MPNITAINPSQLAPAIAPFPQAISAGGFVFISGQVALDADNAVVAADDVHGQTLYIIERLKIILEEGGGTLGDLVSATVFLKSADLFADFNAAWSAGFGDHLPARATVVAALVLDALVIEVQAVAVAAG